jgi:PAS domain-containing protein
MGTWTWDVAADTQTRDASLNRLLGREPVESTQTLAEFLDLVHPDDRATVVDAFASSVEQSRPLNVEFRIVRPDGAVRWLRDQGDIFGKARGASPHMAGACVDVTEVKEAEAALRASEERLRLVVSSATDYAIFTLDSDRRITGWSPGSEVVFGYVEAEVLGGPADILFTSEDRADGVPE